MAYDRDKAKHSIEHLWYNNHWIVVVPLAPKTGSNGRINYDAHHALNDFLNFIKANYMVKEERFHLFGYREGSIPAQTFIDMSSNYFRSLTLVSSQYWDHYQTGDFEKLKALGIPIILNFYLNQIRLKTLNIKFN